MMIIQLDTAFHISVHNCYVHRKDTRMRCSKGKKLFQKTAFFQFFEKFSHEDIDTLR